MTTLKEFLEVIEYKITEGSDFQWHAFGPDAYTLDTWNGLHGDKGYTVSCVFDKADQTVYKLEAWDYGKDRSYRWIHPDYVNEYKEECREHGVEFSNACDTHDFVDVELPDDLYEKAAAMIAGLEYDTRVQVPLTLGKEEMFELMSRAHALDITLNAYVEMVLKEVIANGGLAED